jgi:hypothetical protein
MTEVFHGFSWSLHKHWDVHKFAANVNYYPKPQENTTAVTTSEAQTHEDI